MRHRGLFELVPAKPWRPEVAQTVLKTAELASAHVHGDPRELDRAP